MKQGKEQSMKSKKAAGAIVQQSQSLVRNHQQKSVTPPATQGQSRIKNVGQSSDKLPARRVFESPSMLSRRSSDLLDCVKRSALISNDGSNLASQHNRQASMVNVASSYSFSNQRSIRDILMKFTAPGGGLLSSQDSKRFSSSNPPDEADPQFDHSNVSSQVQNIPQLALPVNRMLEQKKEVIVKNQLSPFARFINPQVPIQVTKKNQGDLLKASAAQLVSPFKRAATSKSQQQQYRKPQTSNSEEVFTTQTLSMAEQLRLPKNGSDTDVILPMDNQGLKLYRDFHQMSFKFDTVIDAGMGQDQIFNKVQGIVHSFTLGLNGTIFAYGQTGAGKTYSIIGGDSNFAQLKMRKALSTAGILPRSLQYLFQSVGGEPHSKRHYSLSFYEIYNEKIFDLLEDAHGVTGKKRSQSRGEPSTTHGYAPFSFLQMSRVVPVATRKSLELRQESDGNFSVADLRRVHIRTLEEAKYYLNMGLHRRSTSSTSLNNQSSRSHSVFQIYMEQELDNGLILRSKLRIVDLAGSEKYSIKKEMPHHEKIIKIQELTSINSSLSALGQCISALSEISQRSQSPNSARKLHIPFRNSKLTRVLKDSLDESSNVALIVCISPSLKSYKETLSTLQFADRAKRAILTSQMTSRTLSRDPSHLVLNPTASQISLHYNPSTISGISSVMPSHHHQHYFQQQILPPSQDVARAYEEEKAIRMGLQQYQHEVIEENLRLKRQNLDLQEKMSKLMLESVTHSPFQHRQNSDLQRIDSDWSKNSATNFFKNDTEGGELISINIIPTMAKQPPQASHKRKKNKRSKKSAQPCITSQVPKPYPEIKVHVSESPPAKQKTPQKAHLEGDQPKKHVRFAEKLDNDSSLDSSMRERIEHNLKYNDDTIFDGISIFQDLNSSGVVHTKKVAEKERYPFGMKAKLLLEEEEEEEKNEQIQIQESQQQQKLQQDTQILTKKEPLLTAMDEEIKEQRSCSVIEDQSGGGQEFWAMMNGSSRNDQNPVMPQKTENNFYGDEVHVSAVQISYIEDAGNKSSQDFSKDLIELEGDSMLVRGAKIDSESKDISIDRSPFQYKRQTGGIQQHPSLIPFDNPTENKDRVNNKLFPAESTDPFENQSAGDDKIFDDPEFDEMPIPNSKNNDFVNENSMILIDEDQQNQPSMMQEEGLNTLILDSQSMILDGGTNPAENELLDSNSFDQKGGVSDKRQEFNLSQQMMALEASRIQATEPNYTQQYQFKEPEIQVENEEELDGQIFPSEAARSSLALRKQRLLSNASSSVGFELPHLRGTGNDEVLTFSLTNTFSTIQSLKDELAAIRSSVDKEQPKRLNPPPSHHNSNPSMMKMIHHFAREIHQAEPTSSLNDDEPPFSEDENFVHTFRNSTIEGEHSSYLPHPDALEEDNHQMIRGIKGFYHKIHNEIAHLKTILEDDVSEGNQRRMMRQTPPPQGDRAQQLICQLKAEMLSMMQGDPLRLDNRVIHLIDELQTQVASTTVPRDALNKRSHRLEQARAVVDPRKIIPYEELSSALLSPQPHSRRFQNDCSHDHDEEEAIVSATPSDMRSPPSHDKLPFQQRNKTPEVFKGLREALREGPDGARSKNIASGRGEEMISTMKSGGRGHNGNGCGAEDQTLTLIFDSSEDQQPNMNLQQVTSLYEDKQDMASPSFLDERGYRIDPIKQQMSGLNVSSFGAAGDLSLIQEFKVPQAAAAAGLSHLNLSRINQNTSLNNSNSFLSSDKPISPITREKSQQRARGPAGMTQYLIGQQQQQADLSQLNLRNQRDQFGEDRKLEHSSQSAEPLKGLYLSHASTSNLNLPLQQHQQQQCNSSANQQQPSTSKTSVHKYWKQYFNQPPLQSSSSSSSELSVTQRQQHRI